MGYKLATKLVSYDWTRLLLSACEPEVNIKLLRTLDVFLAAETIRSLLLNESQFPCTVAEMAFGETVYRE